MLLNKDLADFRSLKVIIFDLTYYICLMLKLSFKSEMHFLITIISLQ